MSLLADRFRAQMAKNKDPRMNEALADIMYSTGFLPLDYLNGYKVHVKKPNKEEFWYNAVGITDGSSTTFVGRPSSGKTTIALQMAANIVRRFPQAVIFYDDIEGGSNAARREILTKFGPEDIDSKLIYRNQSVSAENFFERIDYIYNEKLSHKDDYEYNTGLLDSRGNEIYKLIPTVYILDSLAMLTPEKVVDDVGGELGGQMTATSMAKTNTAVFKRIVPKLKAANIILFVINHITDKIEINAFVHTKSQVGFLKQNESLPGGKAALYLANNMIRVDDGTVLKPEKDLGIYGKIVDFTYIKSRTNASGRSVPMVFSYNSGFDEILSLFMYLKSNGAIEMKGAYCNLRGYPDMRFTQKGFKDKLLSDNDFAQAFMTVAKEELETLLAKPVEITENNNSSYNNIIDSILGV